MIRHWSNQFNIVYVLYFFVSSDQAYLQFETEEEARAMAKFYNGNVTASVCGRPVRVSHSMSYPTIQVRNNTVADSRLSQHSFTVLHASVSQ